MLNMRLEFHLANSHKYYSLKEIGVRTGKVLIRWGRCLGRDVINGESIVDYDVAIKKLNEKLHKGYKQVN